MWMLSLSLAVAESQDLTVSHAPETAVHQKMDDAIERAMTKATKELQTGPSVFPCPKEVCKRYPHTSQEAYDRALLSNGWLAKANRYHVGDSLLPSIEGTSQRRFVEWQSGTRQLWVLMDSGQPKAMYATWTLDALEPSGNPFDPNRLTPLNDTLSHWLSKCNQSSPIDVDKWQNVRAWNGIDCNGWNIWMEYTPTQEAALSLIAILEP